MAVVPITKQSFANKRFKPSLTYHFASRDVLAPLVLLELNQAVLSLPIVFTKVEGQLILAALQGSGQPKNLFVAPDGRWIGRYLPFCYRFRPFSLAPVKSGEQVLCCDDSSDLISDIEGQPFFDQQGAPSKELAAIAQLLGQHAQSRLVTLKLCHLLEKHGLIVSCPIKVKAQESDNQITLGGLFCIDEKRFSTLSAEELASLNQAGAFPLIYGQLLSMQHVSILGELGKVHQALAQRTSASVEQEIDLTFSLDDSRITFEGL